MQEKNFYYRVAWYQVNKNPNSGLRSSCGRIKYSLKERFNSLNSATDFSEEIPIRSMMKGRKRSCNRRAKYLLSQRKEKVESDWSLIRIRFGRDMKICTQLTLSKLIVGDVRKFRTLDLKVFETLSLWKSSFQGFVKQGNYSQSHILYLKIPPRFSISISNSMTSSSGETFGISPKDLGNEMKCFSKVAKNTFREIGGKEIWAETTVNYCWFILAKISGHRCLTSLLFEGVESIFAQKAYPKVNEHFPRSSAVLLKDYLPCSPICPYDGEHIRYHRQRDIIYFPIKRARISRENIGGKERFESLE